WPRDWSSDVCSSDLCTFRPKVVFEHNVEFQLRKRKWQVEKHPIRKMVFGTEWRKTRPLEARVSRCFDHVLTVSEEDQRTIQHEFGIDHVSTLPTGVDTDYFRPLGNHTGGECGDVKIGRAHV